MNEVRAKLRSGAGVAQSLPGRDVLAVVLITGLGAMLAARFELSEALFAWTRPFEHLQLDELPAIFLVLTVCLVWFAWRRYREARDELARRRAVEARLEELLLDNRRLAQGYLRTQEEERKALARELHDELGQYLNAIKLDALAIQHRGAAADPAIERPCTAILQHVDHVYGVVRDLIGRLRPTGLDELGLNAALEHHLGTHRERRPQMQFDLSIEGMLDDLEEPVAMALYRSVQEGLTNVLRHARATRVDVRLVRSPAAPGEVVLSIVDDGCGTEFDGRAHGLGLLGMRERIETLGGRLQLTSAPGRGFGIRATLPTGQDMADSVP